MTDFAKKWNNDCLYTNCGLINGYHHFGKLKVKLTMHILENVLSMSTRRYKNYCWCIIYKSKKWKHSRCVHQEDECYDEALYRSGNE